MVDPARNGIGIQFDRATGRLRLSTESFVELVEQSASGAPGTPTLTAAGVYSAQGLHPLLGPGLAAVRAPVCRLRIQVAGAFGSHLHQGWIAAEAAASLLHGHSDHHEFLTTGPTFTPAAIARVLRLEPRPAPTHSALRISAHELVDQLFAPDPATRLAALADIVREPDPPDEHWRAGRAVLTWAGPYGVPTGRELTVLDRPSGILIAERQERSGATTAIWTPATTSALWRRIVMLLPDDSELEPTPPGPPQPKNTSASA
jgi:hypothetical protein